jgi:anti-sigma regulatory factor (Ser/Thr protein kinase)
MIPSARRLMESLRDIGYDTPAAIADLVDNSIDADARNVEVTVAAEGSGSWIRVADDGKGMSAGRLDEAMRYGSSRSYDDEDLGAFGLGLKTASLSQCRQLTVATRASARARVEIRRWDLDRVARRDAWELQRLTPSRCAGHLTEPLRAGSGTVVLWEGLDRTDRWP